MPVFNRLDMTRSCVASLLREEVRSSWELIVVDNGSTDGTRPWLAKQQAEGRLQLVPSLQNKGFARGCNLGARQARGRHLLFLNNDMEMTPGWLDPMVETLAEDLAVGVVGARLLFPDGTIQHGGVALVAQPVRDQVQLGGFHLGYRKPADFPAASRARQVQAVTGACLMIRLGLFAALGGFDEGYWNGNEDVDLCLRVGKTGWKVVYVPESVVIHHESQSGPERWSRVDQNVKRLNEKWRGRVQPDFVLDAEGKFQPTELGTLRRYHRPVTLKKSRDLPLVG